jgi:hypothetical protein
MTHRRGMGHATGNPSQFLTFGLGNYPELLGALDSYLLRHNMGRFIKFP